MEQMAGTTVIYIHCPTEGQKYQPRLLLPEGRMEKVRMDKGKQASDYGEADLLNIAVLAWAGEGLGRDR